MSEDRITHEEHEEGGGFYLQRDGQRVGELTYRRTNASLAVIDHTYVAPHLRENGHARRLLDAAVQWARETGTKLQSTCWYASAQFEKDPSLRDVLG